MSAPALAIESSPGRSCFSLKFSSIEGRQPTRQSPRMHMHLQHPRILYALPRYTLTWEAFTIYRASAGPVMSCEIATLKHELLQDRTRGARMQQ